MSFVMSGVNGFALGVGFIVAAVVMRIVFHVGING